MVCDQNAGTACDIDPMHPAFVPFLRLDTDCANVADVTAMVVHRAQMRPDCPRYGQ